ncbi:hypothetical protein [Arthrobacter methylotrophus]|uniref:hypothetical protein n=1 Tax=Arthrobacter methylotrophus TaxID=121291 RepID=UPI0031E723EA
MPSRRGRTAHGPGGLPPVHDYSTARISGLDASWTFAESPSFRRQHGDAGSGQLPAPVPATRPTSGSTSGRRYGHGNGGAGHHVHGLGSERHRLPLFGIHLVTHSLTNAGMEPLITPPAPDRKNVV